MTEPRTDKTGAPVHVDLGEEQGVSAYTVALDDGTTAGRADFVDPPDGGGERVFFHTEVASEFRGRGLGGLLVRETLDDSIRRGVTVVPVCSLFGGYLEEHGDEYTAKGGRFRPPEPADLALVRRTVGKGA